MKYNGIKFWFLKDSTWAQRISVFFLLTHRRVFEAFYGYFLHLSTTWSFPMKVDISKIFIIILLGSNDFTNATFYFYCLPVGIFWYNLLFGQLISMKKSVAPLEWWMCKNFVWNVRKCQSEYFQITHKRHEYSVFKAI